MAKAITPADARKNLGLVHTLIDEVPKDTSAAVGMNALGQLADMLPHEEFVKFVDDALHHATTGEAPPDEDEQQQTTQGQPPAGEQQQ